MLTLTSANGRDARPLLYVQRSGWVLWAPDSSRFVFSDAAFMNHYFIRVCWIATVADPCVDFSPNLESLVRKSPSKDSELDKSYLKALLWSSSSELLVGAHFVSFREVESRGSYTPVQFHYRAYLLNVITSRAVSELDENSAKRRLGKSLDSLIW